MHFEDDGAITRIWILRHGRSTLNDAQTFQGCDAESELTNEGVRGAKAAGGRLRDEGIDAIYASPLQRAARSAMLVRAALQRGNGGPRIETDAALREMELPGWEGLPYATVRERYAEKYRQFRQSPENFSLVDASGKEMWPVLEMEQRVHGFLSALARNEKGKKILLVTHGGPTSIVLLAALRLQVRCFHAVQVMHGGLSCVNVQRWPDRMKVEVLNEMSHLGADLPKLKEGKSGFRLLLVASDGLQSESEQEGLLARMLERLPIHRALAAGQDGVTTAMRLLKYRRRSTIETCTATGLRAAIERQLSRQKPDELVNLLIAGHGDLLSAVVKRTMRWDELETPTTLESCLGLSVLHLPRATEQPVLQAMNIYGAARKAAGGTA
jgi:broad specificity phosphatase PhoE